MLQFTIYNNGRLMAFVAAGNEPLSNLIMGQFAVT